MWYTHIPIRIICQAKIAILCLLVTLVRYIYIFADDGLGKLQEALWCRNEEKELYLQSSRIAGIVAVVVLAYD